MGRASRFRILLGASIIVTVGVLLDSNLLTVVALLLVLFSCIRPKGKPSVVTNYTEIYGSAEDDDEEATTAKQTPFNTKLEDIEEDGGFPGLEREDLNP